MGLVLRFLLVAAVFVLAFRALRGFFLRPPQSRFPCATCANCKSLFDDGALCTYGGKETFKNEVHVGNCTDYRRARAS